MVWTDEEKLTMLKSLLNEEKGEETADSVLLAYLSFGRSEGYSKSLSLPR